MSREGSAAVHGTAITSDSFPHSKMTLNQAAISGASLGSKRKKEALIQVVIKSFPWRISRVHSGYKVVSEDVIPS